MLPAVLTAATLSHFTHAFRAHPDAVVTPSPQVTASSDLERLLGTVGGWSLGDFRFVSLEDVERQREQWAALVRAWEEGTSEEFAHAHWHRDWSPVASTAHVQWAFDPRGCFGGAPGQLVSFDFKGGEGWDVYPSLAEWIRALSVGLRDEFDALGATREWAEKNGLLTRVPLPQEARRSTERFDAGAERWLELVHPDGTRWAVRVERAGYALRLGDPADPLVRRRECAHPKDEVARLIAEQRAAGFTDA